MCNSNKWPLIIDPQEQANKWVRQSPGVKVVKAEDKELAKTVSRCIEFGNPVMIEDCSEDIDSLLSPLLLHQQTKSKDGMVLKFNERVIDYHPSFRLYLTTKHSNPQLLPEVFIKCNVLNFLVTHEGLQDQLLVDVVKLEIPMIEQQKDRLIVELNNNIK